MLRIMAPEGYPSNLAAVLDLMRFGPGIWSATELLVLYFHVERSTVMGRDSDQHSQRDALQGVYSPAEFRWIRGPAGVSKGSWVRANRALVKAGVLKSYRHRNGNLKDDPTEYVVIWPAIARAIDNWKETERAKRGLLPAFDNFERREEA